MPELKSDVSRGMPVSEMLPEASLEPSSDESASESESLPSWLPHS